MKLRYAIVAAAVIVGYNIFLIHRDQKMFDAYDTVCAHMLKDNPDCIFAKDK